MTVHDNIDSFLVADLHGELSDAERSELQGHLLDCATCRQAHHQNEIMNQLLVEKLEKPDEAFEQRLLAGFRKRVPEQNRSVAKFFVHLMHSRSAQIAAVAAVLLALVQVGHLVTEPTESERVIVTGSNIPTAEEVGPQNVPNEALAAQAESQPAFSESLKPPPAAPLVDKAQVYGGHVEGRYTGGLAGRSQLQNNPYERDNAISQFAVGSPSPRSPAEVSVAKKGTDVAVQAPTSAVAEASAAPAAVIDQRKLIRNAKVELEIVRFEDAVEKITAFANEERGYIATSDSQKQANGKLRGELVVKVLPENLDHFLQKVRGLGELKNQTVGTEDVTKAYFDTDARLKNAHVMEQRLIDMLKTKTGKVSDLLQVEKELGRVREEIEKMQGELKYWDSQVQFATVTISLAEKDLEEPAAFLLKEGTQVALYVNDVEKIYNDLKTLASPKVQITTAQLDRDNAGRVAAHLSMLVVPEESDAVVSRVKGMGRVENFQVQTDRVAQGGNPAAAGSENAKTKRDKVELNITISRETDEQAVQETSLRILTSDVGQKAAQLKNDAAKSGAEIRSSTFSRDPDGREVADISVRVAMENYATMMKSLNQLGELKDVSVQRHDKIGKNAPEENAPADVSIQIYSRGNIVSSDTGPFATLRNTVAQGAVALMWSLRMIGVAIAFLAPWAIALAGVFWMARRIARARNKT